MQENTENWVPLLRTRSWKRCREAGLVLTALQIEYEVERFDGRWVIIVPRDSVARARVELSEYDEEKRRPPVGILPLPEVSTGWRGVIAYIGVLLVVALFARQGTWGHDWLGLGRIDSVRILAGEWWRTVTALTLHVDFSHLAGNIVFGAFFGLYVGRYLGSGIGWAAILGGGALGNALNVLIQPGRHLAIGASTAVFAALGLLAAYTWRRGFLRNTPWRMRIAPIIAGIGLLAFTGTGSGVEGDNVDILAHLTGFVAGFGIGVALAAVDLQRDPGTQKLWGAIGVSALVLAWATGLGLT
ncbi:MAG: rhomboid family intramembrane serine protease [Rhodospirillaceae bacterium]|nr:rhomboid family intramembrane serine protease [Rhodospirillaceae bacterium]